jgi:hypothetical protein
MSNTYTVEYKYATQMVVASDSDMAVIAANALNQEAGIEDAGELYSITLHDEDSSDIVMKAAAHPDNQEPLPSRRQRGMALSMWYCEDNEAWQFDVIRFKCSSSLEFAYHEEELQGYNKSYMLNDKDMEVIQQWIDNTERYIELMESKGK